ncbi:MAG: DUF2852 domain-containing protein [Pseudomonadota bacterium]
MSTLATATHDETFRRSNWFSRAEAWLDARGRGAWIAAMVLGFIFFWPVGLALVIYMTVTNKWGRSAWSCGRRAASMSSAASAMKSSGNAAFDAYKADTLRRLEEEQESFEAFLERLRAAKDKAEFDQFMDERAKTAGDDAEGSGDGDKGTGTQH